MKLILSIFEQLSILKINFHKSGSFCFDKAKEKEHQYSNYLAVNLDVYLLGIGVPIQEKIMDFQ
jgi:hypothetical protein